MFHSSHVSLLPRPLFRVRTHRGRSILSCAGLVGFFLALVGPSVRAGTNLVVNPGFEEPITSWAIFIPQESEGKGCEFLASKESPHMGATCGEMKTADVARFAISPRMSTGDYLKAGDRVRLTFWIKAAKSVQTRGNPSFLVRMPLVTDAGRPLPDATAIFVGLNGHAVVQSMGKEFQASGLEGTLPFVWTKVETVFDIPDSPGVARAEAPSFFVQYVSGEIYLDDVSIERVPKATPLTPGNKP